MYGIDKTEYGFRLTFAGEMGPPQMRAWLEESRRVLAATEGSFSVLVDMRRLEPLGNDAKALMVKGQHLYRKQGMQRSAVVVERSTQITQFRLLARSSGIHAWEHYINAAETSDWETQALAWVRDGIAP